MRQYRIPNYLLGMALGVFAIAIGLAVTPAYASVGYCHPSAIGGVKPPMLSATGITGSGRSGYSCSYPWTVQVVPEYESNGLWHVATFTGTHHPITIGNVYERGTVHEWTPGNVTFSMACSYRWRYHVYFSLRNRILVSQTASGILKRSCLLD